LVVSAFSVAVRAGADVDDELAADEVDEEEVDDELLHAARSRAAPATRATTPTARVALDRPLSRPLVLVASLLRRVM
jgi:hypothetical protein